MVTVIELIGPENLIVIGFDAYVRCPLWNVPEISVTYGSIVYVSDPHIPAAATNWQVVPFSTADAKIKLPNGARAPAQFASAL
jgi:hypothetical protein